MFLGEQKQERATEKWSLNTKNVSRGGAEDGCSKSAGQLLLGKGGYREQAHRSKPDVDGSTHN